MSDDLRKQIETLVREFRHPALAAPLGELRALRSLAVDDGRVQLTLRLGFPSGKTGPRLLAALRDAVRAVAGVDSADIDVETRVEAHTAQQGVERLSAVKNVIAVASGKGGVGKSTVAVNLALALAAEGAAVGMLDADVYGPSQPRMLGVSGKPRSPDGKHIEPMVGHGLQSMSIGYLIDPETATVWRGPMVSKAFQQMIMDTNWDALDYLIVDMPPGTGDIQLTLSQQVPLAGAVVVTTPQDIATQDARKGIEMFNKVNVPILGVVENMSTHLCSACGHEEHIFGEGGGARVAERYEVALLGNLPLDVRIREQADNGRPTVVAEPDGEVAARFAEIAMRMTSGLARTTKDYARAFPKIVVENT